MWGSLRLTPIKTDGSLCVLLCFLNKQITKIVNPNVPNKVCSLICKMNAILTIFDFDNDDHHILYEVTTATKHHGHRMFIATNRSRVDFGISQTIIIRCYIICLQDYRSDNHDHLL